MLMIYRWYTSKGKMRYAWFWGDILRVLLLEFLLDRQAAPVDFLPGDLIVQTPFNHLPNVVRRHGLASKSRTTKTPAIDPHEFDFGRLVEFVTDGEALIR